MWKKIINQGEKVALELSRAERTLLLTGLVYLHERVEEEIRSTPPGVPVKISLGDLDDMAGHVAGEANHAKSERTEENLGGLFEKIEQLLALYAKQKGPETVSSATLSTSFPDGLIDAKPLVDA
jgi:hypothetical protein